VKVDRALLGKVGALKVALNGLAVGSQLGDRRSPFRGRGMEFADHRPYRAGDDLRLVDWNVYNRLRKLLVRIFHEDRNLHIGLCLDCSASMGVGSPRKADHGATLTAAIGLIALKQRDTVTLSMAGGSAPAGRIRGHQPSSFARMLSALEGAEPSGAPDLSAGIRRLTERGRLDRAVLLSDMLVDEASVEATLRTLTTVAARPVLLHVLDRSEVAPDLKEGIEAIDSETGEVLHVGDHKGLHKAYQKALSDYLEHLRGRCAAFRVHYEVAYTNIPVQSLILDSLRRSRVVESARGGGR